MPTVEYFIAISVEKAGDRRFYLVANSDAYTGFARTTVIDQPTISASNNRREIAVGVAEKTRLNS